MSCKYLLPHPPTQGYFLTARGRKAEKEADAQQYHREAKAVHMEAKDMRALVLGKGHLEVAVSLQQAAISMAVSGERFWVQFFCCRHPSHRRGAGEDDLGCIFSTHSL